MGKQFLDVLTNIAATRTAEEHAPLLQKLRKLDQVAGVGGNGQLRRSALDPQIIEERSERTVIGIRSHAMSMGRAAEQGK